MKEIIIPECNKEYYNIFEEMLVDTNKCCFVSGTGTGKTLISSKFIKDHDLRTLVVLNQHSIEGIWLRAKKDFGVNINIVTYQSLHKYTKKYRGYDCYIFDEAHHAGAKEWKKSIIKLMNYKSCINSYFIGLTATPVRYSDGINVVDEIFDGNAVYGLDRYDAIELGIVPPADYICTLFDSSNLLDEYKGIISDKLYGRLKASVDNVIKIDEAFKLYTQENPKGIVFADRIDRMDEAEEIIRKSFPDIDIYSINCKMSRNGIIDEIDKFKNAKSAFIISVNMMNEGFHINGVNTLVLLRKTKSPIVYLQQIGRGSSDVEKITIFDFVANNESIEYIDSNIEMIENSNNISMKHQTVHKCKFSNQFIIKNYAKDVLDVLKEIDLRLNGVWTDEEDELLRKNYKSNGAKYCSEILNRSIAAVVSRAYRLNLSKSNKWTDEEIELLVANYKDKGIEWCAKELNRPIGTIINKIRSIIKKNNINFKRKSGNWSIREDNFLIENYKDKDIEYCIIELNRSGLSIIRRANKLGLNN